MESLRARLRQLRGWPRRGMALALGALAALALPPTYVLPALLPSFVGLVWLAEAADRPRQAFYMGWWWGWGFFIAGLYWVGIAFFNDSRGYEWLAPLGVLGLAAVQALFPAVAALALRLVPGTGPGRILVFAAAWTAMEWVRSWAFSGFPWNLLGSVWAFADAFLQPAAWIGTYGLGLVTVSLAAMPAVMADKGWGGHRGWLAVAGPLAVLAGLTVAGAFRLAEAGTAVVPDVRLRLVQPNIPQKEKWARELRGHHVARQVELSRNPSETQPTHVIWGETMVPFFLTSEPRVLKAVGLAAPEGGLVVVGAPRGDVGPDGQRQVFNSLHALDRKGEVVATYDKAHLVPFGEYVPLRGLLPIGKLAQGTGGDFSAGPGIATLRIPGLPPVSPLICYEVIFPGAVASREDRPRWLLNLTNDSWYGRSSGPYQHFVASRLRAVEEGLPLVRVANGGISGIVDAYGRVRTILGLAETGIVDGPLPDAPADVPPYARYGDAIPALLALAWGALGLLVAWRGRRRTS
ncbi:MAG: apolipoprotein N-acyltransferase [Magnetospirillum sp. WYHS-4]